MATEEETQVENGEMEQQARQMGWMPKEDWKGKPDGWVDAAEFVKRGETFIPFLQHDRKKLKGELEAERQARLGLEQTLREMKDQVDGLKSFSEEMAKDRTERRKTEIAQALKNAREAGDDVKVAELQNELGEVTRKPNGEVKDPVREEAPKGPVIQPWVREFIEGNDEFFKSGRKVALFNAVMLERRQGGDSRVGPDQGTALLTEVRDEVEKTLGGNSRRTAPSKTEESRPAGGGRGSSGGKGWTDLPEEARQKCSEQAEKFVGKGKAFKDEAAWRKHYVAEYFGPSAITRRAED